MGNNDKLGLTTDEVIEDIIYDKIHHHTMGEIDVDGSAYGIAFNCFGVNINRNNLNINVRNRIKSDISSPLFLGGSLMS